MPNHLITETSHYLLQHAQNPVDWYPWGNEALKRAEQENKPIFLSIGYSACHWCHVMAHESFEDPAIADLLNQHFICIKVDREERPDLDDIYMSAVVAMTGQGGWPLSVFLTPQKQPFYGGTYFPPVPRYRMPSFREVITAISTAWQENRPQIQHSAEKIAAHLHHQTTMNIGIVEDNPPLAFDEILHQLEHSYDWNNGGWASAPKFPAPMTIDFLLFLSEHHHPEALKMATHALRAMQTGGLYDLVNGGFHRYSTDEFWRVPHFEKMLYDNAQLAAVYLHAYLLTNEASFKLTCQKTLDFILAELSHPQGGFFSSLDADSDGAEGLYYLWSYSELEHLLAHHPQKTEFFQAHHLSPSGNFNGHIILQHRGDAQNHQVQYQSIYALLKDYRSTKPRPAVDDKVILSWNALACRALAEAGRYLNRSDYLRAAQQNAHFLLERLCENDRLSHSWCRGKPGQPAFLDDVSALILALIALYQADFNDRWLAKAVQLASTLPVDFSTPEGQFFDTPSVSSDLLFRPANLQDNATPSGSALSAMAFLQLFHLTQNPEWHEMSLRLLGRVSSMAAQHPLAYSCWLQSFAFEHSPVQQIALLHPPESTTYLDFLTSINQVFSNLRVVACSPYPPPPTAPQILLHRPLIEGAPTLYICRDFTCHAPITDLHQVSSALRSRHSPE